MTYAGPRRTWDPRPPRTRRPFRAVAVAAAVALTLTSCQGAFDLPLPGLFACVAATNLVSALVYAAVYARAGWTRAAAKVVLA